MGPKLPYQCLSMAVLVFRDGKSRLSYIIYSNFVTVLGQCLSVAITISNKMYVFQVLCVAWRGFSNPVTYSTHMYLLIL